MSLKNKKNIFFIFFINNIKNYENTNLLFFEKKNFNKFFKKKLLLKLINDILIINKNNFLINFEFIKKNLKDILYFYYNGYIFIKNLLYKINDLIKYKILLKFYILLNFKKFSTNFIKMIFILKKWV